MKKTVLLLVITLSFFSCKKEVQLNFEDQHLNETKNALIDIHYPKATGTTSVADKINDHIENAISADILRAETAEKSMSVKKAVTQFNDEFVSFQKDFDDSEPAWEVKLKSEVAYKNNVLTCIAINSYVDTGGAHGNSRTTYLNFNTQTGNLYERHELLKDTVGFKTIAKKAFMDQSPPRDEDEDMEDFFYGEEFQIPANIGFIDKGMVLIYNNYDIASYDQGTTVVILPFDQIREYLKIDL